MNLPIGQDAHTWIEGTQTWVDERVAIGWEPYYVNVMFSVLEGGTGRVREQMRQAIEARMYPKLCCMFTHHPRKEQHRLPFLILFPDRPVAKRAKTSLAQFHGNDGGLHYNGLCLTPPFSRLKVPLPQLLQDKQYLVARGGISRVKAEKVWGLPRLVDYAAKTLKWGREPADGVIILPRSASELPSKPLRMTNQERAIKDVASATNYSEATARGLLMR